MIGSSAARPRRPRNGIARAPAAAAVPSLSAPRRLIVGCVMRSCSSEMPAGGRVRRRAQSGPRETRHGKSNANKTHGSVIAVDRCCACRPLGQIGQLSAIIGSRKPQIVQLPNPGGPRSAAQSPEARQEPYRRGHRGRCRFGSAACANQHSRRPDARPSLDRPLIQSRTRHARMPRLPRADPASRRRLGGDGASSPPVPWRRTRSWRSSARPRATAASTISPASSP